MYVHKIVNPPNLSNIDFNVFSCAIISSNIHQQYSISFPNVILFIYVIFNDNNLLIMNDIIVFN